MITRDVEVSAVADLALHPPRVALAAAVEDEILVLPVSVILEQPADPALSARIVDAPADSPDLAGRNVVVIADDGPQWFRLRSLTIRGVAQAVGDRTYRIAPERIVAWDYGSLREAPASEKLATPRPRPFSVADDQDHVQLLRSPNFEEVLGRSRVMILASRSDKGTPFAVPLWFSHHQGRIYATTSASSWTVRNVAASPQVALLLGGEGHDNGRRLLVRGRARAVHGMAPPAVLGRILWSYYLRPRFAAVELAHVRQWILRMRYYGQSRPAYIVITPEAATECRVP